MKHPLPWIKILGACGALYGAIQLFTWIVQQYDGHQEKIERNDSAYVWSWEALDSVRRQHWQIRALQEKLK